MSAFMANAGGGGDAITAAMARRSQGVSPMSQQAPQAPGAQPVPTPPQNQASVTPPGMNASGAQPGAPAGGATQAASPGSFESKTILGALKGRLDTISRMQENGQMQ